jgi:hypothetical protein
LRRLTALISKAARFASTKRKASSAQVAVVAASKTVLGLFPKKPESDLGFFLSEI